MSRWYALFVLTWAGSVSAQSPLPPIQPLSGPLVIVGGGGMPAPIRQSFVDLAGKEKARIVVVPTASIDADDPAKAESFVEGWKKAYVATVTLLHARSRKDADDATFLEPLTKASGVWFSGGDQSRIMDRYRGTKFETELKALQARGGVIGGTSAGAAIMSGTMIAGGTETARVSSGFDLLPGFVVDQHFVKRNRQPRLNGLLDRHPGLVGLGIDEATAVVVTGRQLKVIGESTATVVLAPGAGRDRDVTVLKNGQSADLLQLRRAAQNRAATRPFPPATVPVPEVSQGALVIVGGGGTTQEIMDRFFTLAGGKDKPIVVVPTANEGAIDPKDPGDARYLRRWGATNVLVLHTKDRKEANDPKFSESLTKAGGVWFGGGRQWRFVDSYENTLTEKRFHEVLARGGVIGGSSAGASIQSEYMPRGHPLGNTVMAAEGYERGFGFLPGAAVDQHFFARKRTNDMTGLMKQYPQYLGIGIDEATAVVVKGSQAEVIGRSKAAFYNYRNGAPKDSPDYVEVKSGESYDLKERRKRSP